MFVENERYDFGVVLKSARAQLLRHPLFGQVRTLAQMRLVMQSHVFAVWDFMSLLKTLQNHLTCTQVPWMPPANPVAARFINEIVLGEECDEIDGGQPVSHFELYLEAMQECGAETRAIEIFMAKMRHGMSLEESLREAEAPAHVRAFVSSTLSFCRLQPHQVAAAFFYGREDIIPDMFARILTDSSAIQDLQLAKLRLYLNRHIEVDGGDHGPKAAQLMQVLCGEDPVKWREAELVAEAALNSRAKLWDGVLQSLNPFV